MEQVKIILCGSGFSGKSQFCEYLFDNPPEGIQWPSSNVNDCLKRKDDISKIEFQSLNNNLDSVLQWAPGSIFYEETLSLLLEEIKGMIYMFECSRQGRMKFSIENWNLTQQIFSEVHGHQLAGSSFPLVFCFNKIDLLPLSEKEEDHKKMMEQVIQKAGMEKAPLDPPLRIPYPSSYDGKKVSEKTGIAPASPTIHRYLLSLNKLLNPYGHPWFVTSAPLGYNVEEAFLKLIELVEKREEEGEG